MYPIIINRSRTTYHTYETLLHKLQVDISDTSETLWSKVISLLRTTKWVKLSENGNIQGAIPQKPYNK